MQNELQSDAERFPAPSSDAQRLTSAAGTARAERALRSAFGVHSGDDPGAAGPELLIFGATDAAGATKFTLPATDVAGREGTIFFSAGDDYPDFLGVELLTGGPPLYRGGPGSVF
jgi:hypothetical protein